MKNQCLLIQDAPLILLATRERTRAAHLREELEASEWRVRLARNAEEARAIAVEDTVAVLIVDLLEAADGDQSAINALRGVAGPSHAAPILALATNNNNQSGPISSEVDALLPHLVDETALVRALKSWRPVSLEPTRRIVDMFGSGPIAGMMQRLALRLDAALVDLDRGKFDKGEAHRLAGLCGTLGFAQAHAAWLDLSLGDEAALSEARRTTRLTLAAIARWL